MDARPNRTDSLDHLRAAEAELLAILDATLDAVRAVRAEIRVLDATARSTTFGDSLFAPSTPASLAEEPPTLPARHDEWRARRIAQYNMLADDAAAAGLTPVAFDHAWTDDELLERANALAATIALDRLPRVPAPSDLPLFKRQVHDDPATLTRDATQSPEQLRAGRTARYNQLVYKALQLNLEHVLALDPTWTDDQLLGHQRILAQRVSVAEGTAGPLTTRVGREGQETQNGGNVATPAQIRAIYAIGRDQHRLNEVEVDERARALCGVRVAELTRTQASELIARFKAAPNGYPP